MRYRILVVEPVWEDASRLSTAFDTGRFALYWARDLVQGRSALRRLDALDVAIVRPALPDGRGLDLCREMKSVRPSLPIVVFGAPGGADRTPAPYADVLMDAAADPLAVRASVDRLLPERPRRRRHA